jgi:hypothetical protein
MDHVYHTGYAMCVPYRPFGETCPDGSRVDRTAAQPSADGRQTDAATYRAIGL